ncbi:hypothetical protein TSUD_345040 [Trifolium subterraneum]|nr:hypothetical protein TSUD_345040 [Trifolium subterraneum]
MYASVTDRGYEGSVGGSGAILIPSRFVWPHGGRRVFLTGSFTRWSEHIPMSPMEGCPSVFQVICSLMPGYHQYKFNVDGEWRHAIDQPIANGTYGVVNTIHVVREPDILPAILSAETTSRSHMEVDNDVFGHACSHVSSLIEIGNGAWFIVIPSLWMDCSFQHNWLSSTSSTLALWKKLNSHLM